MVSKTPSTFTDRERTLIAAAFECLKSKPDIDYDLMATKTGLKNAKSARDSFTPLMKKLMAGTETEKDNAAAANGETPKKRGVKRKEGAADDEETPAKKRATPKKGKKVVAAAKEAEDEDDEEEGKEAVVKGEESE